MFYFFIFIIYLNISYCKEELIYKSIKYNSKLLSYLLHYPTSFTTIIIIIITTFFTFIFLLLLTNLLLLLMTVGMLIIYYIFPLSKLN